MTWPLLCRSLPLLRCMLWYAASTATVAAGSAAERPGWHCRKSAHPGVRMMKGRATAPIPTAGTATLLLSEARSTCRAVRIQQQHAAADLDQA